jgi:hypothetical protein
VSNRIGQFVGVPISPMQYAISVKREGVGCAQVVG